MPNKKRLTFIAIASFAAAGLAGPAAAQQPKELTLWSHWAAEMPKRTFVEEAITDFEEKNPGIKIKPTWYEKTALYAGLKTALRAGQAPDIFYAEPDQVEYNENGFLLDLSDLNWADVEPWAKQAWSYKGKPYGLPLEAWTVELYYNKKLMAELGVKVPENLQLSPRRLPRHGQEGQGEGHHADVARRRRPAVPGAHLMHEALLQEARHRRLRQAAQRQAAWTDPRVVDTLKWVRSLVDAGLLPTTFTSLKLGEAHIYFHTNPGALTFLNGSWYTLARLQRAGQRRPAGGLPARDHEIPGVPGAACHECRRSRSAAPTSSMPRPSTPRRRVAFLNSFATPEMGNRGSTACMVQTGIKSDPSKISGPQRPTTSR